jgi:hypothetical protein
MGAIGSLFKLGRVISGVFKGAAIGAVADGALNNGAITQSISPHLPDLIAKPAQALSLVGKGGRTVVDAGVGGIQKVTDYFNSMSSNGGGLLAAIGGLVASSIFMPPGIIKSVAELACFAGLLYFGYKMAANAGWIPDGVKNTVEGFLPFLGNDKAPAATPENKDTVNKPILPNPALTQ